MFAANGSRRIGLRLPFLLLAALIVGIMVAGAGTLVWQARQSTLAEAHAAHRGTARALSRHVFHVVRSSEVLLDQMLAEWQRRDDPASLHQSLQQLLRPLSELNVAVIVDGQGRMLAAIDEAGATVELGPLPVVTAIESQMVGLFQNLFGNAIKYADPARPPHVAVTTRREGGDWVIRVADNGIGIAAADRDRVFQVFQRLHRRGVSGSGVGLALCRRIAERHRGSIRVEDREDDQPGCVFVLRLPALPAVANP